MPPNDLPTQGTQPLSDDAQRKLWFEYLAKLNDRELQSSRASGFTPWALFAVGAAIIYKGVPQIPTFLSIAGGTTTTLVIIALEADALFWGIGFVFALIIHCAPGIECRLLPEHNKRVAEIQGWITWIMVAALAAGHFLASKFLTGSRLVRWVLVVFGIVYLLILVIGICVDVKKANEAKKHKLPLPLFSFHKALSDLGSITGATVVFPIAVVPLATLLIFLRSLHHAGIPWVMPLGAATDLLGLAVVLIQLFSRALGSASTYIFLALERDLILENLPPSEIKARFIREALGPLVGDWLEMLNQERRKSLSSLVGLTDSLKSRVEEIEAIDPGFPLERQGRAKNVLADLDGAINRYTGELEGFLFQLQQVTDASISARETRILTSIRDEWKAQNDQPSAGASPALELKNKLLALVQPSK